MGLNLSQPVDIVNTFFANSGYVNADIIEKKDRLGLFGVVKDGLIIPLGLSVYASVYICKNYFIILTKLPCQFRIQLLLSWVSKFLEIFPYAKGFHTFRRILMGRNFYYSFFV